MVGATILTPEPERLLRGGELGRRLHLDRDAAQPAHVPGRRAHGDDVPGRAGDPVHPRPRRDRGRHPEGRGPGALGIVIPMVDDVKKAQNAVLFAKYPPLRQAQPGQRAVL